MMLAKPKIIIAANRWNNIIILGPRHWDSSMRNTFQNLIDSSTIDDRDMRSTYKWEQGFIDQFGKFYTREEAMEIVKENGQPFSADRNVSTTKLFSEGLY